MQSGAPKESSTRRSKNAKGEIGDIQSRLATVDKGLMQQFNISLRLPFEPVGERGMQLSKSGCRRLGDNRRAYQVVGEPERLALFDRQARTLQLAHGTFAARLIPRQHCGELRHSEWTRDDRQNRQQPGAVAAERTEA